MHIHGQIPHSYEAGKAKGVKSPCSEMRSLSSFKTQLNEKPIPTKERRPQSFYCFMKGENRQGKKILKIRIAKPLAKPLTRRALFDRLAYQMNKSSTDFSTFQNLFNKLIFQNLYGLDRDLKREISHQTVEFAMNLKSY